MVSTLDSESSDPSLNLGGTWNLFSFSLCVRGRPRSYLKRPKGEWDGNSRSNTRIQTLKETIWLLLRLYFAPKEDFSYDNPRDRFSKSPLFFFLVGHAILKDFSYLFGAKFTSRKFYRWLHDNWPIGQWVIFHAAPDISYVNLFFPREFIIWFKSIQAKQVDHETSSLARSLYDLMYRSSLRSHLRTYEKSTCSKSILGTIK